MEEIGVESRTQGAGRSVKSFLIGMSVVFLGPVGLLFIWLWRREWLQKRSIAVVTIAWSAIYTIGVLNSPRDEEPITTVSASEVDEQTEDTPKLDDKIGDDEKIEEESGEDAEAVEEATEPAPAAAGASHEPAYTTPTTEPPTQPAPTTPSGESGGFPNTTYDDPAGECIIKGNVNSKGEKIYHTPASKSYKRTKINPDEGDQLFCTRQEAEAAGFRAAED